ncbi:MAG: glycosyltransferase [Acidobacteria bacterium]|nr:glycosyltransferase [Acidobacteriota bacterium]NIM61495.1 glycosyltransferase [Acidobacteriota bacterium]NIO58127.1 glycosyltransferase [Acidobacteriota bacterium]NIQ29139.1 glycosyltransferase [Acidobacteriota bacterium]NIQ83690.1 glycosyltransferase [Acidobacteriota bacterium]
MSKPRILVVQDYFLPAYKGGGSLRTVVNIIDRLSGDFDFDVLARDRDQGDSEPFPDLSDGWTRRDGCRVRYLPPHRINPSGLRRAAAESDYELIYFNSFFSRFTVWLLTLRRLGMLPDRPVLLAPRGELAANTLRLKRRKKAIYIRLARLLGLYRGITWHASSESEREEIRRLFDGPVEIGADLAARPPDPTALPSPPAKRPGELRLVFLSRLARKKNLGRAIELAGRASGDIVFDIYGTAEDPAYLAECEALIRRLPSNVRCTYRGPISYEKVHETLAGYHVFLFPTLNENFGHVILEALLARLPVVLSDQTFWRDLESKGAGFDLPLADDAGFDSALRTFVEMDQTRYDELSRGALALAHAYLNDPEPVADQREMFRRCLGKTA